MEEFILAIRPISYASLAILLYIDGVEICLSVRGGISVSAPKTLHELSLSFSLRDVKDTNNIHVHCITIP